jgi:hypothetical protein
MAGWVSSSAARETWFCALNVLTVSTSACVATTLPVVRSIASMYH